MAGESLLGWMYPEPGSLPPKDSPTQPPHPRASQHPGHHTLLQDAWAAMPTHMSRTCRLHSPIPVALDTHHARQGHASRSRARGPQAIIRAAAPLLAKHRHSRTAMCPSEAADRKQSQPQQKPLATGHPEPGAVGQLPGAHRSPGRSPTLTQKQVKSQRRHLTGGLTAQRGRGSREKGAGQGVFSESIGKKGMELSNKDETGTSGPVLQECRSRTMESPRRAFSGRNKGRDGRSMEHARAVGASEKGCVREGWTGVP